MPVDALLQPGQVLSRDTGQTGQLVAPQPLDPAPAVRHDTRRVRGHPGAAGQEEFAPIELDVTDRAQAFTAVSHAADRLGRLDVVVNNAGYGLFGMIEEISEEQAREQINTNLLGPLWVSQAALPVMREQGHGHLLQVSTIGGTLVDLDDPPLRLFLGEYPFAVAETAYRKRLATWQKWRALSEQA